MKEKKGNENMKKERTSQLVFKKDELLDKLGDKVLTFALEVGLLSQCFAPGSFDEENVSINFFHKTIEEFLAALYLVYSDEVSFDSFRRSCSGIKSVIELSNILLFTVGLQPNLGSVISEHIDRNADSDPEIINYRKGLNERQEKYASSYGERLKVRMLLCDCNQGDEI